MKWAEAVQLVAALKRIESPKNKWHLEEDIAIAMHLAQQELDRKNSRRIRLWRRSATNTTGRAARHL